MDNDNVIAYIYPALGTPGYRRAVCCIKDNTANPQYLPPIHCGPQVPKAQHCGSSNIFARRKREATVDEEDEDEEEHDDLRYEACIKVTFNHIPKTTFGLQAGWSNVAELRLIKLPGVGVLHFALTFDKATFTELPTLLPLIGIGKRMWLTAKVQRSVMRIGKMYSITALNHDGLYDNNQSDALSSTHLSHFNDLKRISKGSITRRWRYWRSAVAVSVPAPYHMW